MAALSLIFDILARDKASRAFDDVGDAADRAGKKGGGAGQAISSGMKLAAGALLGGGLIAGFVSLYEAAAESAKVTALTEQVIKSTGSAANLTANQVGDLVGAISNKTGVDDEAIQSGANLLLTFTNLRNETGEGNDIFTQTTQIMTDMSVALGTDASGSAIQLGKALNDPIKGIAALSKVGVSFTEQQKQQIKTFVEAGDIMSAQKIILEELGREFGGAAEAAATPLDKLKVTVGNLQEEIGAYLIPVVDKIATFFMEDFLPAARDVGGVIGDVVIPVFKELGPILKGAFEFVGAAARAFGDLPGPVQTTAIAVGAFLLLSGPLAAMFAGIVTNISGMILSMALGGSAAGVFRGALTGLLTLLSPMTIAVGLLTFAIADYTADVAAVEARMKTARDAGRDFATVLAEQKGRITDTTVQAGYLATETLGLSDAFEDANISMRTVSEALAGNKKAYEETLQAAQNLDQQQILQGNTWGITGIAMDLVSGKATENADAFGLAAEQAKKAAEGTDAVGDAAEEATPRIPPMVQALQDTAGAASDARQETDLFKTSLDILSGESVSMIQVESAFQAALASATGAMENQTGAVLDGAGSLNLQSESGRAAADVLLKVRDSGNQLIATLIAQGGTEEDVRAKDAQLRQSFINTANQMGITGGNADRLADQILGIPGERTTKINADTSAASAAVDAFVAKVSGRVIVMTGDFMARPGVVVRNALGNYLPGGAASIVPPNAIRIIGDRMTGDEAYIPVNRSERSRAILSQTAGRMGFGLAPMADGGMLQAGQSWGPQSGDQWRDRPPTVHVEQFIAGGQSPTEIAEALAWLARTR